MKIILRGRFLVTTMILLAALGGFFARALPGGDLPEGFRLENGRYTFGGLAVDAGDVRSIGIFLHMIEGETAMALEDRRASALDTVSEAGRLALARRLVSFAVADRRGSQWAIVQRPDRRIYCLRWAYKILRKLNVWKPEHPLHARGLLALEQYGEALQTLSRPELREGDPAKAAAWLPTRIAAMRLIIKLFKNDKLFPLLETPQLWHSFLQSFNNGSFYFEPTARMAGLVSEGRLVFQEQLCQYAVTGSFPIRFKQAAE